MFKNYFAKVTKALSVGKRYFIQQITYRGKTAQAVIIFPYGMHASPKEGSFVQVFENAGDSSNRTGIAWNIDSRPDLADGDVALYLPEQGTLVKLAAADGSVSIDSDSSVTINANAQVTINNPDNNTVVVGDFVVFGDVTISGNSTAADHISGGKSGATHVHGGVQSGGSSTAPPT